MAGTHTVTLSPKIYLAHFDISADANAHSIQQSVNIPMDERYGDTFERHLIGTRKMSFSLAGNVDLVDGLTDSDSIINARMGVNNVPLIMTQGASVGDACEFGLIVQGQYTPQLPHGDVFKYGLTGQLANRKWVRGRILWAPGTSITGTANGAEVELGAVSATQKLYVAIAVLADDFSNLEVRVESDTTGFPSTTAQRAFTASSGVTSEMPTPVDGAITDTFYRAAVTAFTGTSGQMIVVAGVA